MGFQDEKVVAAGDGFSDCICGVSVHVNFMLIHSVLIQEKNKNENKM